ncbi:MAG: C40 family peptidase [Atopobiaceae bacterium]|nr:C40 family peptidase [Atopobiaceae bacterium]
MSTHTRAIVTASLAFALGVGGMPATVYAQESQEAPAPEVQQAEAQPAEAQPAQASAADLDAAWTKYGELSMQVAEVGESLNDTYFELGKAEEQKAQLGEKITAAEGRLATAQDTLANRISANYKAGASSLLDIVLGTNSLEELVSALHYIDKVTARDLECVNEVKDAAADLQTQQTALENTERELRELATQKEQQLEGLKKSLEDQQGFIAGLSAPLRAAFDEKQVSEIVEQQARAVEALAAQEAALANGTAGTPAAQSGTTAADVAAAAAAGANAGANAGSNAAPSSTDGASVASAVTTIAQETAAAASGETSSGGSSAGSVSTSGLSSEARAKILEAAYSQIGVQYVYGASSPGEAFDCSGLTSWAYEQAGIEIPHSSAGQASMATASDELQPGDLVFYIGNVSASQSGNHVAIYAGDGQVIHANGSSVVLSDMNENYTSAGSIGLYE